jgi:hypothetical protein
VHNRVKGRLVIAWAQDQLLGETYSGTKHEDIITFTPACHAKAGKHGNEVIGGKVQ